MISMDKIYLLTYADEARANILQIFDADDIQETVESQESAGGINRDRLDVLEETRFGFGLTFRLVGLMENIKLWYHETVLIDGQYYSGYSEVMGSFGRTAPLETAHYYCPRTAAFGKDFSDWRQPELDISIRTDQGIEVFARRWQIRLKPKSALGSVFIGEPAVQMSLSTTNSPTVSSPPHSSRPSAAFSESSSSRDSLAMDSFVDVAQELDTYPVRSNSAESISVPKPPNVLEQMGIWLYGSKLGQMVASTIDESRQRAPKQEFYTAPLWLLGIRYDLKRTLSIITIILTLVACGLTGFQPKDLIPAISPFALPYNRKSYLHKQLAFRKLTFRCSAIKDVILGKLVNWIAMMKKTVQGATSFSFSVNIQNSIISYQAFNGPQDTTILDIVLTCDSKVAPIVAISFLHDSLRCLRFDGLLIDQSPMVSEWIRLQFDPPQSAVADAHFRWELNEDPLPTTSNNLFFWDPVAHEWIAAVYTITNDILTVLSKGNFRAFSLPLNRLALESNLDILTLIKPNGREFHLLIPDPTERAPFATKLYMKAMPGRPKCHSLALRKKIELERMQQAFERRTEIHRRKSINSATLSEFSMDFGSRFWFCYRRDMPRLSHSLITTDAGWGCMIRCGQMMMAEAYARMLLGRGWNHLQLECGGVSPDVYQSILCLFEDRPSPTSPFGIHAIVNEGASLGHPVGQWYQPTLLARIFANQSTRIAPTHLIVVACDNGMIKMSYLRSVAIMHPILILLPMRFGIDYFNPIYTDLIAGTLEMPQSVGIVGGKPGRSFYIVGHQEKQELFYLDPHVTRDLPSSSFEQCMISREFHTNQVLSMSPTELDPTVMFGFFIANDSDLEDFISVLTRLNLRTPVFSFIP